VSQSSDKLTAFSRRQPTNGGRQRVRKNQTQGQNPVQIVKEQQRTNSTNNGNDDSTDNDTSSRVRRPKKDTTGKSLEKRRVARRRSGGIISSIKSLFGKSSTPAPTKQSSVKQSSVKQSSVKQSSVKQSSVKQSSVKQSSVKQTLNKSNGVGPIPINSPRGKEGLNRRVTTSNPSSKTVSIDSKRVQKTAFTDQKANPSQKTRLKPMAKSLLYGVRLLIIGVGIGAIVGTALSVLDPASRMNGASSNNTDQNQEGSANSQQNNPQNGTTLALTQEISPLKTSIQNLASQNPNLTPGVFLVDLDTGAYVDFNGGASFSSASTIKLPILIAFFQDVEAGKIRLDEMLTMEQEMVATGSGDMQYKKVGSKFSAIETATKMMTVSDNTATNMLIARLGGIGTLNERLHSWGLSTTNLRNILPDIEGTNTTSPKELTNLLGSVLKGNLVNQSSQQRIVEIMQGAVRRHLLPAGVERNATVAHKTGDIGTMLADTGVVQLPTGKRYLASIMVHRPKNDPSAEKFIASISRVAYQQFSQNPNGNQNFNKNQNPVNNNQNPVNNNQNPVNNNQNPVNNNQNPVNNNQNPVNNNQNPVNNNQNPVNNNQNPTNTTSGVTSIPPTNPTAPANVMPNTGFVPPTPSITGVMPPGSMMPPGGYPPSMMRPMPNGIGTSAPFSSTPPIMPPGSMMPPGGYQPPMMRPMPSGVGIPNTGYQPPMMNSPYPIYPQR